MFKYCIVSFLFYNYIFNKKLIKISINFYCSKLDKYIKKFAVDATIDFFINQL